MGIGTMGGRVDGDERRTPPELFQHLTRIFHFNLDPCSTEANALTPVYYTADRDGLTHDWTFAAGAVSCFLNYETSWIPGSAHDVPAHVFLNPPYSRGQIGLWLAKARHEADTNGTLTVALIPGDSSTKWWRQYVRRCADHVEELERRIAFLDPATGLPDKAGAKFPSVLAFYWPNLTPPMVRGKR